MDAESTNNEIKIGLDFSDSCILYRLVHNTFLVGGSKRPRANIFNPETDGLSTDWNRYSTPEDCLIRTGLTYKFKKNEFKVPGDFQVYSLNVGKIRTIEQISDLQHTPVYNNPELIGQPNNPSHSSVFYIDEEVRLKLAEFAEKVEDIDIDAIHNKIEQKKITLFAQIIK